MRELLLGITAALDVRCAAPLAAQLPRHESYTLPSPHAPPLHSAAAAAATPAEAIAGLGNLCTARLTQLWSRSLHGMFCTVLLRGTF